MPKKRQPFYFFMLEVQKKNAERGKRYSLREMPDIASPMWANMSKEEKKPYEEMAKHYNGQGGGGAGGNIKTCHGVDYSEIEREQRQVAKEEKLMKEDVREMIKRAILSQTLTTQRFFLIHINYFCESKDGNGDLRYDPAELAILEFSLQDGIGRGMHTLINLREIPYGYYYEAKRHSGETHNLPLPPDTVGNTNIRDAIIEVIKFVNYNDEDVCSPVFTFDSHIPVVRSVIREVLNSRTSGTPIGMRVYSLSELLFNLKEAAHDHAVVPAISPPFASVFLAESYLDRGTFDYAEGLPCEFHEANDRVPHCSQTKIRGWAFSIIKSCGQDLGIEFMPGKHEPESALAVVPTKFDDNESVYTSTDIGSDANQSHISVHSRTSELAGAIANSANFPRLADFRRGKGRGNLV